MEPSPRQPSRVYPIADRLLGDSELDGRGSGREHLFLSRMDGHLEHAPEDTRGMGPRHLDLFGEVFELSNIAAG
jgi:hypothetical protein